MGGLLFCSLLLAALVCLAISGHHIYGNSQWAVAKPRALTPVPGKLVIDVPQTRLLTAPLRMDLLVLFFMFVHVNWVQFQGKGSTEKACFGGLVVQLSTLVSELSSGFL